MRDATVRRFHGMPFGAEVLGAEVRFRLWAPDADRVELVLDGRTEPLVTGDDGWWQTLLVAPAGSSYGYRIDGGPTVPDPASRHQPRDVHGPSEVIDPREFAWPDADWHGRPWEEVVLYELHAGAFARPGGFEAIRRRLDDLAELGVTAVELMPVSDFPGRVNWGYDGVLPFAPDASYGRPEALKRLVAEAHGRGLMVFLDVVYNHFGPEGNYLHLYARPFFNPDRRTPWGDAINFDGEHSATVRDFFVHNALYWLEEYHLDGLRIDAVHAIHDASSPGFLDELADRVRAGPGAERHVHLVLENYNNEAHRLERDRAGRALGYDAQWNDDVHHALHCLLTAESTGYYADFADDPALHLGRALAEGFAWQGQYSGFAGAERGERSAHLPPTAFVNFLQNHDQIGNRAFGERLTTLADARALRAALGTVLLAPAIPLLFMGEEYGCRRPFPFFCDFGPDLASAVTEGRRREFERFPAFADESERERIPDPNAAATFDAAVLDWSEALRAGGVRRRALYRELLELRRREIVPRLNGCPGGAATWRMLGPRSCRVEWRLGDGALLLLLAHLDAEPGPLAPPPAGRLLWSSDGDRPPRPGQSLAPWSSAWFLDDAP